MNRTRPIHHFTMGAPSPHRYKSAAKELTVCCSQQSATRKVESCQERMVAEKGIFKARLIKGIAA